MKRSKGLVVLIIMMLSVSIPFQVINGKMSFISSNSTSRFINDLYADLQLDALGLDVAIFKTALEGHQKLDHENKLSASNLVTIVDLSQPSTNKRMYIVDLKSRKLLFNTYVAHGKNSGDLYATHFSNIPSSLQSSLGFYVTGNVYNGKHGLSLQLLGQEPGFNDEALDRAIVLHGADYVSESFIKNTGRLGRSFGCPAVASELATPIINTIHDGSCLFVYFPDPIYFKKSILASISRD
ncbi:MAG: murein L,D-transpeptidase catalytic domain family protein [Bacteroidetes bacterium]|nr:murein L,D-transpeptidase catalytic domain family protein [Bacteroidota bacterium]